MKNIKLLLILIFCITVSCSNDNSNEIQNSEYHITFEVNNKKTIYTNLISANRNYNAGLGIYGVSLIGAEANTALSIYLYDTVQINTETYTGEIIPNKYISRAIISYGVASEGFTSAAPNISTVANALVTITEINDVYIAGNFTGTLVANSDYNTITHTIKNGKFKIKFLNE